uniref:Uncharacterized protein n=1 Tax=Strongyloides papillosus TaxID=174720 RepID=A0A0N5BP53_STREA
MKVFKTLILFIILFISKRFETFVSQQKCDYYITVKPTCKCEDKTNEEVSIKLFENGEDNNGAPIKSNSRTNRVGCNDTFILTATRKSNTKENLLVEIEHFCNKGYHKGKIRLMDACEDKGSKNNVYKYYCEEK